MALSPCRWIMGLVLLSMLAGCQTPEPAPPGTSGPRPLPERPQGQRDGRMLLETGAIQLGPGVGRNLWGWQGDGLSGF